MGRGEEMMEREREREDEGGWGGRKWWRERESE